MGTPRGVEGLIRADQMLPVIAKTVVGESGEPCRSQSSNRQPNRYDFSRSGYDYPAAQNGLSTGCQAATSLATRSRLALTLRESVCNYSFS